MFACDSVKICVLFNKWGDWYSEMKFALSIKKLSFERVRPCERIWKGFLIMTESCSRCVSIRTCVERQVLLMELVGLLLVGNGFLKKQPRIVQVKVSWGKKRSNLSNAVINLQLMRNLVFLDETDQLRYDFKKKRKKEIAKSTTKLMLIAFYKNIKSSQICFLQNLNNYVICNIKPYICTFIVTI